MALKMSDIRTSPDTHPPAFVFTPRARFVWILTFLWVKCHADSWLRRERNVRRVLKIAFRRSCGVEHLNVDLCAVHRR